MKLEKIDHPRRIDQFRNYFGEPRYAVPSDPRPYAGAAVDLREPRRREATSASSMTASDLGA